MFPDGNLGRPWGQRVYYTRRAPECVFALRYSPIPGRESDSLLAAARMGMGLISQAIPLAQVRPWVAWYRSGNWCASSGPSARIRSVVSIAAGRSRWWSRHRPTFRWRKPLTTLSSEVAPARPGSGRCRGRGSHRGRGRSCAGRCDSCSWSRAASGGPARTDCRILSALSA